MVVPTGSNLYSETWNIVHGLVSGNVADPALSSRASNKLKWIYGAFPDVEQTRPDFPIVVIENPEADSNFQTFGTGGMIQKDVSQSVWVYSASNQQVNAITDDLTDAFQNNRLGLQGSGLQLRELRAGAAGTDSIGNQRIHFRETQAVLRLMVSGA